MAKRKSLARKLVFVLLLLILAFLLAIILSPIASYLELKGGFKTEVFSGLEKHKQQAAEQKRQQAAVKEEDIIVTKDNRIGFNQVQNIYGDILGETLVLYYFNDHETFTLNLNAVEGKGSVRKKYTDMTQPQQIEFRELCKVYSITPLDCPSY